MSNDPVDGGTVTYHRADYHPATDEPWLVWFTKDQADPYWFTAEQGEAMGLTPPEPAPLVVECNGHRIELPEDEAAAIVEQWADKTPGEWSSKIVDAAIRFAGLLRDARQDPQPASDENAPGSATPGEQGAGVTCTPAPDTDSGIDFDALPIGTVLRDKWGDLLLRRAGGWFEGDEDYFLNAGDGPYTVVYQPAPLSPGECLRGLLAGETEAAREAMIANPEKWMKSWLDAVYAAARGGA